MFNNDFYPTPNEVIKKMVQPYIKETTLYSGWTGNYSYKAFMPLQKYTILEPSAGKGNILDCFLEITKDYKKPKIYCIEPEPDLQHILRGKGYKVIANDFLNFKTDQYFNLILMNPPFSNGEDHFLKAWTILKEGNICCLLNAETLKNQCTSKRQLLQKILVDNNATITNLGQCFATSERPTSVEVVMIHITKQPKDTDKLKFNFTKTPNINLNENTLKDSVATIDVVANMITQSEQLKQQFIKYLEAREAMSFYSQGLTKDFQTVLNSALNAGDKQAQYNEFSDGLRQQMWYSVLSHLNIEKYMTDKVKTDFLKFREQQADMEFTKENIFSLVNMIFDNRTSILDKAIVDVFDTFTAYHKENRLIVEGWKTNDQFKVNRKVILPYFIEMGYSGKYRENYRQSNNYTDIDKVMCYLSGKEYSKVLKLKDAIKTVSNGDSSKYESEFFYFRCYKKGTLHIEFKDEFLWQEFNMRACDGKNWLPHYEKKQWQDQKPKNENKEQLLLQN